MAALEDEWVRPWMAADLQALAALAIDFGWW
jgi:hypothetical protein